MDSFGPIRAIVWAQWRTSRNFLARANKSGLVFNWIMNLGWYAIWLGAAAGIAFLVSGRVPMLIVGRALPGVLFLIGFFWQMFPIVLASQGASIDMQRLLPYPIPDKHLFLLETVLRVTTALEMILVCAGLIAGLLVNPAVPLWSPLAILAYMALNLLLATGIKGLLARLFRIKGVRELMMVFFLGLILVPQFLAASIQSGNLSQFRFLQRFAVIFEFLPWSATAALALGRARGTAIAGLAAAVVIAYVFARLQFARSLQMDDGAPGSPAAAPPAESRWFDRLSRLPSLLLLDPIATIVEKDIRTLARAPRFRLIFLMASTFGAVLWLPQALRSKTGWIAQNYVTMATLYGMLVLGEVLYWNVFGFERAGSQQWFVTPVRFRDVLRAKNCVAIIFTLLTVAILSLIAAVLPVGIGPPQIADALAAAAVFLVFVLAGGNLTSVYMPRPIDPEQAWRNTSSRTQFLLLLAYPLLSIPIGLAHLARWGSGSYWAYHGVLAVAFLIALCFYSVATESAEQAAEIRKEKIVATLSHQDGPISITN